jgi:hypothetical protein
MAALMRKRQRALHYPRFPRATAGWRANRREAMRASESQRRSHSRRDVASVCPARPTTPCRGACRTPSTARTLPWRPRSAQRRDGPPFSATLRFVCPLLLIVRRTPGISCEAVPASMPLAGAGMRRHAHSGNHAAESFVSFIPLFDGVLASSLLQPRAYTVDQLATRVFIRRAPE